MPVRNERRAFLARILGWSNERAVQVALRSLSSALNHHATLMLYGEGDMVPIAWALHLRTQGPDSPFVVCDPRRPTKRCARPRARCPRGSPTRSAVVSVTKAGQ